MQSNIIVYSYFEKKKKWKKYEQIIQFNIRCFMLNINKRITIIVIIILFCWYSSFLFMNRNKARIGYLPTDEQFMYIK